MSRAGTESSADLFDTLSDSRKATNLRENPSVAFVIGSTRDGTERTVQYEGVADMPSGDELRRVQEVYFEVFPDGRDRLHWKGLIHVRVKPLWIRRLHPAQIKSRNGEERRGCPLSAREKNRAVPTTTAPTSAASRVP